MPARITKITTAAFLALFLISVQACAEHHAKPAMAKAEAAGTMEACRNLSSYEDKAGAKLEELNAACLKELDDKSQFAIFFMPDGGIQVKHGGKLVKPNQIPLDLVPNAKRLESLETLTIFEYSGSPRCIIIIIGGVAYKIPVG